MQFWHIFQIPLVVLIINCTPSGHVITYTYMALTFILQWTIIADVLWLFYIIFGAPPPYPSLIFLVAFPPKADVINKFLVALQISLQPPPSINNDCSLIIHLYYHISITVLLFGTFNAFQRKLNISKVNNFKVFFLYFEEILIFLRIITNF